MAHTGFLIDLHCHTIERSFDGKVSAQDIVRGLMKQGFHGVVFTDHSTPWPSSALDELRQETKAPADFFLASGQEVRVLDTDECSGDLLVYGPTEPIADGTPVADVMKRVAETNGFAIAAHIGATGVGLGERAGYLRLAAAETWNGRYGPTVAERSRKIAQQAGLVEVGGSDTHQTRHIGGGGTLFAEMPKSLDDIKILIREELCRPWKPPLVQRMFKRLRQDAD